MSKNHNIKKYIVIVTMLLCLVIFITIRWIIPYMRIIKSSQSTENTTDSINDIQVAQVIGNKSIINKTDYNINSVNIIKNIENIPKNLLEQYKDINISNENLLLLLSKAPIINNITIAPLYI
jgi:lipopolysaccharide export LptBFGC system permease protein LptF